MPQERGPILVIDDHLPTAEIVTDTLTDEGYVVVVVPTFDEAIRRLSGGQPCLILCDVVVPEMSIDDFVRAYRKLPGAHAPLVLFTADVRAEQRRIDLGAVDVLVKPFALDDLVNLVARHCEPSGPAVGDV